MNRAIIRHERWTVGPDVEPDREPDSYAAECVVCLARSPREEVPEDARDWILRHAGHNPSHHTYRAIAVHPLRAWRPDA